MWRKPIILAVRQNEVCKPGVIRREKRKGHQPFSVLSRKISILQKKIQNNFYITCSTDTSYPLSKYPYTAHHIHPTALHLGTHVSHHYFHFILSIRFKQQFWLHLCYCGSTLLIIQAPESYLPAIQKHGSPLYSLLPNL